MHTAAVKKGIKIECNKIVCLKKGVIRLSIGNVIHGFPVIKSPFPLDRVLKRKKRCYSKTMFSVS